MGDALRVLVRLGIVPDRGGYAAMYRAARAAAAEQLGDDPAALAAAHRLLRRHGQEICKRADPLCGACVLAAGCAYARALPRPEPGAKRGKRACRGPRQPVSSLRASSQPGAGCPKWLAMTRVSATT